MNKIMIFVDSCSSVTKVDAEKVNIRIIPTLFNMDGKDYNPLSEDVISYQEFYGKLEDKMFCKTSCINPNVFVNRFEDALKEGYDVIYISLSSGLSASFNNANLAKEILSGDYSNTIELIDSRTGSVGIQVILEKAIKMRDEGKTAKEIREALENNKINVYSLFTIGSLDHLRRGGRLSTVTAIVGTVLKINPIICANKEGKLTTHSKHRGRRKAINALIEEIETNIVEGETLYIGYTNNLEEAEFIEDYFVNKGMNVHKDYIDYTMGSHCGPRTIAVFFMSKKELEA